MASGRLTHGWSKVINICGLHFDFNKRGYKKNIISINFRSNNFKLIINNNNFKWIIYNQVIFETIVSCHSNSAPLVNDELHVFNNDWRTADVWSSICLSWNYLKYRNKFKFKFYTARINLWPLCIIAPYFFPSCHRVCLFWRWRSIFLDPLVWFCISLHFKFKISEKKTFRC